MLEEGLRFIVGEKLQSIMPIHFESEVREARILNPLNNFQLTTQSLEHRADPLSGRRVIVSKGRIEYVKRFIQSEQPFLDELAETTQANCPFCPKTVEKSAPKFPKEIAPEGRIRVGEAVCFPSLFAHEDFNALVVPTTMHHVQLNEFTAKMLFDGFKACLTYFSKVVAASPEAKYPAIVMNFLPPAGSTIVHPHIQALASYVPTQGISNLLTASESYAIAEGVRYWDDLVGTEKKLGTRYLKTMDGVDWLTPYAPMGLNEAQAIVLGKSNLETLSDNELMGLADGFSRVLRYYHDIEVRSFNATIYSGPMREKKEHFSITARIVSRYGYKPKFVSDVWALQYLLSEQEVYESPEETCLKLRKYFE
jgi:UDPglucose--hexose-1-phosphate uridylyltransferase